MKTTNWSAYPSEWHNRYHDVGPSTFPISKRLNRHLTQSWKNYQMIDHRTYLLAIPCHCINVKDFAGDLHIWRCSILAAASAITVLIRAQTTSFALSTDDYPFSDHGLMSAPRKYFTDYSTATVLSSDLNALKTVGSTYYWQKLELKKKVSPESWAIDTSAVGRCNFFWQLSSQ